MRAIVVPIAILIISIVSLSIIWLDTEPHTKPDIEFELKPFELPYVSEDEILGVPQMWIENKHLGIDFTCRMDTRYVAVHDGKVSDVRKYLMTDYNLWAITVFIRINQTCTTIYVFEPHTNNEAIADIQLQKIEVKPGDMVTTGQLIGRLYASGFFPHLHFAVSENNVWINPFPFFSENAKSEILRLYRPS